MSLQSQKAQRLDGRATAKQIRAEVADGVEALKSRTGKVPGLTVVLVGEDAASQVYVRNKEKAAAKAGMRSTVRRLPASTTEQELLQVVEELNGDPEVHGILVQLPLPAQIDASRVLLALDPDKDVDGFHPVNAGRLLTGLDGFVPCTPAGILEMLERYEIPMKGRHAVVIGRSNIVGKPMAVLLLRKHCTVTVCHSRTEDLPAVARRADILIAAVGRAAMVDESFIKPGAVVVDVGIHPVTDEGRARELYGDDAKRLAAVRDKGSTLVGDVHPLQARAVAGWLSPVPGGVGPLTIAMLLKNTLESAVRHLGGTD